MGADNIAMSGVVVLRAEHNMADMLSTFRPQRRIHHGRRHRWTAYHVRRHSREDGTLHGVATGPLSHVTDAGKTWLLGTRQVRRGEVLLFGVREIIRQFPDSLLYDN